MLSLLIHTAALCVLGLLVVTVERNRSDWLWTSPGPTEPSELVSMEFPPVDLPSQAQRRAGAPLPAARDRPSTTLLLPTIEMTPTQVLGKPGSGPTDDVRRLFGHGGSALLGSDSGNTQAEFFGVQAAGTRFVFVVDSSSSMRGKKWSKACRELLKSVGRLGSDRFFYVIFFDAEVHPMFSQKRPEPDLLRATSENQTRLRRWLASLHFGSETRPWQAVRRALAMQPDAVFLLSDGEFVDPTRQYLRAENRTEDGQQPRVVVHTIGFYSPACAAMLRPIAQENGGVYRFVSDASVGDSNNVARN